MNKVTQEKLDWFVEGEMDSDERDQLFLQLDDDLSGWKRCALALLERQALCNSLANTCQMTEAASPELGKRDHSLIIKDDCPSTQSNRIGSWVNIGVAMSLLGLLFVAGYWAGGSESVAIDSRTAFLMPGEFDHPLVSRLVDQDPDLVFAINDAIERISVADREVIALVSIEFRNHQLVLPVIESEILNKRFLDSPPPKLPFDLSRKLAKSGFDVQPRRQFLSVHHEDGTNEVLPLNTLDCRYVGKPVF